ncbi:MAG: beta-lactamase family protein [Gemmatimonadota bacterium]|nr:beta-lactamase family protein [Gemmatimonadota bacterium]
MTPYGHGARVGPRRKVGNQALLTALLVALGAACSSEPVAPETPGVLGEGTAGRWATATPGSQGLDAAVLADLGERTASGEFGAVSSMLVIRNGRLVYERYHGDWKPADLHRVYSVTKSVTSLLVGVALEDGLLPGLDARALDLLPGYDSIGNWSPLKEEITLAHALEMRAGFEWDELSTNYANGTNPTVALVSSEDWIRHVLSLPMAGEPGSAFVYNSGVSMLLGEMVARAAGSSTEALAETHLFQPLEITAWAWDKGPGGITNTGWGLWLSPRDMAAIGQLVLDGGHWESAPVVPEDWLDESAIARTQFTDGSGYGYQWWIGRGGGTQERAVAAWGYGGQFIVVLSDLDMVMVSTAENYLGGGLDPYRLAEFGYLAAGAAVP